MQVKNPFDAYTVRARLIPAIIAAAPALAFPSIFVSLDSFSFMHFIAGTALTIVFAVFADIARRRGKAIEPAIIAKMGGLPTTVMLRHRDSTYDSATKAEFHSFIAAKLGQPAPTIEQENVDPAAADNYYSRGITWLRENTRDTKRFGVLFNENISYGFRRNLLGLKIPGFLLDTFIIVVCLGLLWRRWPVDLSDGPDAKLLAVIAISIFHVWYFAQFVTQAGVFEAARTYAHQLLASVHSPYLNASRAKGGTSPPPRKSAEQKANTSRNRAALRERRS
jgi:hypothetical protein